MVSRNRITRSYLPSVVISAVSLVALAACSSSDKKKESAEFGDPRYSEASTPVITEKEVKRVERTREEVPSVRTSRVRGDLNRMEEKHFVALGMPMDVAKSVVEHRDHHGDFKSVAELKNVKGMNEDLYKRFEDKLAVKPTG